MRHGDDPVPILGRGGNIAPQPADHPFVGFEAGHGQSRRGNADDPSVMVLDYGADSGGIDHLQHRPVEGLAFGQDVAVAHLLADVQRHQRAPAIGQGRGTGLHERTAAIGATQFELIQCQDALVALAHRLQLFGEHLRHVAAQLVLDIRPAPAADLVHAFETCNTQQRRASREDGAIAALCADAAF